MGKLMEKRLLYPGGLQRGQKRRVALCAQHAGGQRRNAVKIRAEPQDVLPAQIQNVKNVKNNGGEGTGRLLGKKNGIKTDSDKPMALNKCANLIVL